MDDIDFCYQWEELKKSSKQYKDSNRVIFKKSLKIKSKNNGYTNSSKYHHLTFDNCLFNYGDDVAFEYFDNELDNQILALFKKRLISVDLKIDFHGYTKKETEVTLFEAISYCNKHNLYNIEVITGHGDEILKKLVPNLLIRSNSVCAYMPKYKNSLVTGFYILLNGFTLY